MRQSATLPLFFSPSRCARLPHSKHSSGYSFPPAKVETFSFIGRGCLPFFPVAQEELPLVTPKKANSFLSPLFFTDRGEATFSPSL